MLVLFVQNRECQEVESQACWRSVKRFEVHWRRALTVEKEISKAAMGSMSNRDFVGMRAAGKRHA